MVNRLLKSVAFFPSGSGLKQPLSLDQIMTESNPARAEFARVLGSRIKATRLLIGRSYTEITTDTGIDRGTLTRIEKGEREPSAWVLLRLAPALGVTVDSLMGLA
jgi:DNA-binding XRE family transcriptional regulator